MNQERRGQFRLAKQIGAWGSFADVAVIATSDTTGPSLVFDVQHLEIDPRRSDWIAGVHFGMQYALEHLPSSDRDISIRITGLHTNPVDSSTMSVAFATCFAVWNAVGFVPERTPRFDAKEKAFVFPR